MIKGLNLVYVASLGSKGNTYNEINSSTYYCIPNDSAKILWSLGYLFGTSQRAANAIQILHRGFNPQMSD